MAEAPVNNMATRLRARWSVSPPQMQFLNSQARFRGYIGGRGSGKTHAGCLAALDLAGRSKCDGCVVAPTYTMLKDVVVPLWTKLARSIIASFSKTAMTYILRNGSKVLLRTADQPDRLRGLNLTWFWGEEAALLEEYLWLIMVATLRESGRAGRGFLTTTPRGKNWIYKKFLVDKNPDFELIHATTAEAPFLSDEFKSMMDSEYGISWFAKQELMGEFCDPEGSLFQRKWFDIVDPLAVPDMSPIIRGWDLAASTRTQADFSVGVKIGVDEKQDIYVLDVTRGKQEWPDTRRIIVETAQMDGPETIVRVEKVAFQIAAIQELMREPELFGYDLDGAETEGRDKLTHALPVASRAKAGKIHLVRGAWNAEFLNELCAFSGDGKTHDDQVDALSIAARSVMDFAAPRFDWA